MSKLNFCVGHSFVYHLNFCVSLIYISLFVIIVTQNQFLQYPFKRDPPRQITGLTLQLPVGRAGYYNIKTIGLPSVSDC